MGRTSTTDQIRGIVVRAQDGVPIRVGDVADVTLGSEIRRGAVTADGKGEVVLGLGFMLMGENTHKVTQALKERLEQIRPTLPANVSVEPFYDRTELVTHVIETVQRNLFEGGLLVVLVLATGGEVEPSLAGYVPSLEPRLGGELGKNPNLNMFVKLMMHINLFWPIMNLLPVLPLDGGQIALQMMVQQDPWGGTQRALWLSVITGGVIAVFALMALHSPYMMMLFASLAVSSYLTLQQMGGGGRRPW